MEARPDYFEIHQAKIKAMRCKTRSVPEGEKVTVPKAKKVVIDCDPGGDDAQALILAFHIAKREGIEILGITTVEGNASLDHVVQNAQMVLDVCGETKIPIFKGVE